MERDKKEHNLAITPVQRVIASCTGSILTALLVTPLDVVKVRLQLQAKPPRQDTKAARYTCAKKKLTPMDVVKVRLQMQLKTTAPPKCFIFHNGIMDHVCHVQCANGALCPTHRMSTSVAAGKAWYARPGQFYGTADAFAKIARSEGIWSLWSGLPPTLVMAIPANVIYFTVYDQLKYRMGFREDDPSTMYISMLAGSSARTLASIMVTPLELLRTKLQSERLSYSQLGQVIRMSVRQGGVLSLFRGLSPTLFRDVPFSAVYWYSYEWLKALQLNHEAVSPSLTQSFLAGAGAGSLSAVITQPFDVVKTQRQIELGETIMSEKNHATSTFKLTYQLYQKGLSSFFAGLVPRLMRVAPACAIMISTYEYGKAFFYEYNLQAYRHSLENT